MADTTKRINIEFNAQFRGGAQVKQELRAIENVASMGGPDRLRSGFAGQATQAYDRERARIAAGGGFANTAEGQVRQNLMSMPRNQVIAALAGEAEQQAKEKVKLERAVTSGLSRGMRALLPAVDGLALAMGGIELQSAKATKGLQSVGMAMMGLQGVGASMGGSTGASLMSAGVWGQVATVVAGAIAVAMDAHTNKVEETAAEKAARTSAEEATAKAAAVRAEIKTLRAGTFDFDWQGRPTNYPADPEALKRAKYLESGTTKAGNETVKDWERRARIWGNEQKALGAAFAASRQAEVLRNAALTPEERAQKDAAEMRKGAAAARSAASGMIASGYKESDKKVLDLLASASDLDKRAVAALEKIDKNTSKGWADWALESVGGGSRASRPLALAEIQGSMFRHEGGGTYNFNFGSQPDPREIAMLWDRFLRSHGLN